MKKKKKEPIIIDKTELMPTTIGSLATKENGPWVVIILVIFFGACIFFLPDIISWLNPSEIVETPPVTQQPTTPSGEEEPPEPEEEITYYNLTQSLTISVEGFNLSNFVINTTSRTLTYTLTNSGGTTSFFESHNYYLELYSSDNTLLQRIKMPSNEIINFVTMEEDIAEAISNGTTSKLAFREIDAEEYPNVTVRTNSNNEGILTCIKGTQELVYTFTNENNEFNLTRIEETNTYANTITDYESILTEYTTLSSALANVSGATSDLLPTASGFEFTVTIDLTTINQTSLNRYFYESYYYPRNTLAKVVAFELQSSGYSCT